jgi:hypothetical protein
MKTQQDSSGSFDHAVMELVKAGIQAKRQAYGFSATLHDGTIEAQCGIEHDDSISISISIGMPPVYWFFRPDIPSMVALLINAQNRIISNRSKTWLDALEDENDQYNYNILKNLTQELGYLAANWRKEKTLEAVEKYHENLLALWQLGWRGADLLPDEELPDELMPDYFLAYWRKSKQEMPKRTGRDSGDSRGQFNAWVDRVEIHTLLGRKRISGFRVIQVDWEKEECFFWTNTLPRGGKCLALGSDKAIEYLQRKNVNRFSVGDFGDFEQEFFLLIKDKNGIWYAYRGDKKKMLRIDDLRHLDFNFIVGIFAEFESRTDW